MKSSHPGPSERIAVIGLGYVGLPLALALSREFEEVVGFDVQSAKVAMLRDGHDPACEQPDAEVAATRAHITDDVAALRDRTFYIVAVPTPVNRAKQPDLSPVRLAAETVGDAIRPGAVVVLESTVYPGVTEEVCGPIIETRSGLKRGRDFHLGYSPERINPGDKVHTLANVVKVVSGEDETTLARIAAVYRCVAKAGVHMAPSIKVAEAAKVIENTQRDLNIALMNELAVIFDRLGISTLDVLKAAGTKWNFLNFRPGLVGGHCIGVDPYYLTWKAQEAGHHAEVILAGRRINDSMGAWIGQKLAKLMAASGRAICGARVGVLGITFKEDVKDIRNSRVPDIIAELQAFGANCLVHDPHGSPEETQREYGVTLLPWQALLGKSAGAGTEQPLDAVVLAVAHRAYLEMPLAQLLAPLRPDGVIVDVKGVVDRAQLPQSIHYWRL
ncbi:MAG: nucleotide sugar dehydrogenase [Kiritimatiellae bacterium]|nr:nucleotide sugar dehydrogenase [Kiritimatiellia bacterium]